MFKPWPKIARIEKKRAPVFTEKIDGTNACVYIQEDGTFGHCQSRNKIIGIHDDNAGFANWVQARMDIVLKLGPGYHFGEWWGRGIQRGYDMEERRFSLFNTRRWGAHNPPPEGIYVVPTLPVTSVEEAKQFLLERGSQAAPGFMRIEGAVMYEPDTDTCFKIILDKHVEASNGLVV